MIPPNQYVKSQTPPSQGKLELNKRYYTKCSNCGFNSIVRKDNFREVVAKNNNSHIKIDPSSVRRLKFRIDQKLNNCHLDYDNNNFIPFIFILNLFLLFSIISFYGTLFVDCYLNILIPCLSLLLPEFLEYLQKK